MKSDLAVFKKIILPVFELFKKGFCVSKNAIETFFEWCYYKRSAYYKEKKRDFSHLKKSKGGYGEYLLCYRMRHFKGKWLFNLYIPGREEETEIDALFLSDRGIFLFESKNFTGRVYGKITQKDWFHTIKTDRGILKTRFFNPIMQNNAHKNALVKLIDEKYPIFPMVVFGKHTELYTPVAIERSEELFSLSKLNQHIRKKPHGALTSVQIEELYRLLSNYQNADHEKTAAHIKTIKSKH